MRSFVRFVVFVVSMFLAPITAFGQEKSDLQEAVDAVTSAPAQPQGEALRFSLQSTVMSKYIGALGNQLSEHLVMQEAVGLSYAGWEFKVVGFAGTARSDVTADEVDLWLSYKHKIGDWSVGGGVAYFAFDPVLHSDGDVVMPFLEVSCDFPWFADHTLTCGARFEDRIGKLPEHEHRFDPSVFVRDVWTIADGVEVTQQLSVLYDGGLDSTTTGWFLQYRAALGLDLSKSVSVEAFVRVVQVSGFHDGVREYGRDEVIGVSLTFKF